MWYALLCVAIAVIVSIGETLSRNKHRKFRAIFNRYVFGYCLLNAIFAFATYYFLPAISDLALKPEYSKYVNSDWGRTFISAFGYLAIVRIKFLTIGETPVGIETAYKLFADYCLRHTSMEIENLQSQEINDVYTRHSDLNKYKQAFARRLNSAPPEDQAELNAEVENVMRSPLENHLKCKRIGEILLQIVGTKKVLEEELRAIP